MIYTVTLNPSIDFIVHLSHLKLGDLNRMDHDLKLPGGKGINVSRILNQLAIDTTALGFVGGFTGQHIENCLSAEAIATNFTHIADDTRINIKLKSETETEINGAGPLVTAAEQAALLEIVKAAPAGSIFVLSGSVPPSLPSDFYQKFIAIIEANGSQFAIDTTGPALLAALPAKPLIVKPNHHELAELFDVTFEKLEDLFPYAQKLGAMGAQHVLISMAGDGALFFHEGKIYHANVPKGTVKNSVGAGDSMIAAFVGIYETTKDPLEAFRYGVAAGSATAFEDDLATRAQIEQALATVTVKEITT